MARRTPNRTTGPAWRTQWPRTGDPAAWLRAMIRKCDAITDDDTAAGKAHLPIERLAKLGHVREALRHVDRFLRRLPRREVLETVRTAELGAEICLEAGDLARMERYLALAEATEPFNTRKCDRGFSLDSVRKFRAEHGLLDPADAADEEERTTARFERAARQCRLATADSDRPAARAAIAEMEEVAHEVEEDWLRQAYLGRVIDAHAKLGDARAVKRCLRQLDKDDRDEVLDPDTLARLGMKAEAIARAQRDIAKELAELREMSDPNIHFPVSAIGRSLEFLVAHGAKAEARRWLRRALKEMPTWPATYTGWATSAVYESLARPAALVDGPAAADGLLRQALADARAEPRGDFRQGAVGAALGLKADVGRLDEAIEDARRLRSPTLRRRQLAPLLARAGRWRELREVLSEAASPEEAAELAWAIIFELSGGGDEGDEP